MEASRAATASTLSFRHLPVVLLSAIYLYAIGRAASVLPLWYDEIFTYTVSTLESPTAVVRALLDNADNHPPLDYLARHLSMTLFGETNFAFRLPSVVAVLAASLCLYAFVSRRCSLFPAIVAFALPLSTQVLTYADEGRGYAFLFASMCLSLLAWQLAAEKPTKLRLGFLVLSLCAGPYSHYYGVMNYAPIIAGEAWRSWERREVCWPIVLAVALSLVLLAPLVPFAVSAAEFSASFWSKFGPTTPLRFYAELLPRLIPPLVASLVVCTALTVFWAKQESSRPAPSGLTSYERVAALVLSVVPFLAYVLAEFVTRALVAKYALITVAGVALLIAFLTYCVERWRRTGATAVALCFWIWTAAMLLHHAATASNQEPPIPEDVIALIDTTDLPVVMADPKEFMSARMYLSSAHQRKCSTCLDRKSAIQLMGFDTDERALMNLRRIAPINIVGLCEFTREHRRFFLVGTNRELACPEIGGRKGDCDVAPC